MEDRLRHARRQSARARLLQMHFESRVGHIGGNLSSIDILLSLYHDTLTQSDEFILSKGHAAGALYVALWSVGRLTDDDLRQFHRDNTLLAGHPPASGLADIPFATGSLGHGPGLACGLALARRLRNQSGRVFCLTSDGEWNEGSCWESLIFAQHRALDNLVLIVDCNGLQGFGRTSEVARLAPIPEKFRSFEVTTIEVNGHDPIALSDVLKPSKMTCPLVVIAHTVKGHGVSFMEDRMEWHYKPMTAEQYSQAVGELAQR